MLVSTPLSCLPPAFSLIYCKNPSQSSCTCEYFVTAQPAETRMGKGKGNLEYWVAVVKPGRVMFEISGVPEETAREALRLAMHKLPLKCKIVSREDLEGGDNSEN